MKKTHTIDKQGNNHPVDWHDFMTNDDNPTLQRLSDELLQDSEFQRILKDNGYEDVNKQA